MIYGIADILEIYMQKYSQKQFLKINDVDMYSL